MAGALPIKLTNNGLTREKHKFVNACITCTQRSTHQQLELGLYFSKRAVSFKRSDQTKEEDFGLLGWQIAERPMHRELTGGEASFGKACDGPEVRLW